MPNRYSNCPMLGRVTAIALAALLAGCSIDDASCTETATCVPPKSDATFDAPQETSSRGADASTGDGPVNADAQDGAIGDRSVSDAAPDVRIDVGQPDNATIDGRVLDSTSEGAGHVDGDRTADATTAPDVSDDGDRGAADGGATAIDALSESGVIPDATTPPDVVIDAGDACAINACGGCGPLSATPGTSCGQCGTYVCAADKLSVTCNDPGYVKYKSVSVGGFSTCGLLTTGGVRCWGANQDPTGAVSAPPAQDFFTGVQAIATGWYHSCAIMSTGGLRCWGANNTGQLGRGNINNDWTPPTTDILSAVKSVATGDGYTCALSAAGGVRCWGSNFLSQLGDGSTDDRHAPPVTDAITDVQAVTVHSNYSCALTASGGVRCWGTFSGEFGNGTITTPPSTDLFSGAKAVAAGLNHA
ncbi:MAG TPA: hypothetical protein VK540_33200, partial [Polyangiaceae bacterium]|nr:hypothetical protein [Polyangiaceae bacterium]